MKKILGVFIFLLLLVGCSLSNSPTSKVEDLLSKYQSLDSDIKNGIDNVLEEETLTNNQKERYRKLIEKQYKNLTYQIKDDELTLKSYINSFKDKVSLLVNLGVLLGLIIIIYVPFFNKIANTMPLEPKWWLLIITLVLASILPFDIFKKRK